MSSERILLAFSGGLDTSALVPWLRETYNAEVIAYCSDLGNGPDEKYLATWAKKLGAVEFIFEDVRELFAKNFAFPAIRAQALYQDDYMLGTSLGRPLISERMALHAKKLKATALAHGATGKGNDQLRFEQSWAYLCPEMKTIAPWKIWSYTGRQDLLDYLKSKGFHLDSKEKLYSVDVNLLHRSCEGGVLEDPAKEYNPESVYEWVKPPAKQSHERVTVKIGFKDGYPISLNGQELSPASLMSSLNKTAGENGIGVADMVEERSNGLKSRGVYETPAGTLLHIATKNLKHLCWDRALLTLGRYLGERYAEVIYDGWWHSDQRLALEAFFDEASKTLSGEVSLCIEGGQVRVLSRTSPFALYDKELSSFEGDTLGLHKAASGYSKTRQFASLRAGLRDVKTKRHQLKY